MVSPTRLVGPWLLCSKHVVVIILIFLLPSVSGSSDKSRVLRWRGDGRNLLARHIQQQLDSLSRAYGYILTTEYRYCTTTEEREGLDTSSFHTSGNASSQCGNGGQLSGRLCRPQELRLYLLSVWQGGGAVVQDNRNCNSSLWLDGCEPGFASHVVAEADAHTDADSDPSAAVNGTSSPQAPQRRAAAAPCCPGFFCPLGLACMIPCPPGAYCPSPVALQNGTCGQYGYTPSRGASKLGCGGADLWGLASSRDSIFCEQGSFCPSSTQKLACTSRHFCQKGSFAQRACSIFTSCSSNSEEQTLRFIVILFLVFLCVVLVLAYKFSSCAMRAHERNKERARERAAQQAREQTSAVELLRRAKKSALRRMSSISKQLGRSLQHPASLIAKHDDFQRLESDPEGSRGGAPASPVAVTPPPAGNNPALSGSQSGSESKSLGSQRETLLLAGLEQALNIRLNSRSSLPAREELVLIMRSQAESASSSASAVGAAAAAAAAGLPPGEQQTLAAAAAMPVVPDEETRSQILKYAYAKLETERQRAKVKVQPGSIEELFAEAVNCGISCMVQGRKRHTLELELVNFTLTCCKQQPESKREVLSNVTGIFLPGRLVAVLGPPRAGKTTLLHALAGRETHCQATGQLYINGRQGCMESYQRIVGYVPKDPALHACLTVEEHLWFSSSCRLPQEMPKREKVLVLERTIMALGLEPIRGSLVGPAPGPVSGSASGSAGILESQRTQLSMAIEMVAEPSLLVLDEPTASLDSATARLLTQALLREASRGVTVVVAMQQPSASVFRMFDDVLLLTKRGQVAYMGALDGVAPYLHDLGFCLPDHVSLPEYWVDVAEGIEVPEGDLDFDKDQLPRLWRAHKGYLDVDGHDSYYYSSGGGQKHLHSRLRSHSHSMHGLSRGGSLSPAAAAAAVAASSPFAAAFASPSAPLGAQDVQHGSGRSSSSGGGGGGGDSNDRRQHGQHHNQNHGHHHHHHQQQQQQQHSGRSGGGATSVPCDGSAPLAWGASHQLAELREAGEEEAEHGAAGGEEEDEEARSDGGGSFQGDAASSLSDFARDSRPLTEASSLFIQSAPSSGHQSRRRDAQVAPRAFSDPEIREYASSPTSLDSVSGGGGHHGLSNGGHGLSLGNHSLNDAHSHGNDHSHGDDHSHGHSHVHHLDIGHSHGHSRVHHHHNGHSHDSHIAAAAAIPYLNSNEAVAVHIGHIPGFPDSISAGSGDGGRSGAGARAGAGAGARTGGRKGATSSGSSSSSRAGAGARGATFGDLGEEVWPEPAGAAAAGCAASLLRWLAAPVQAARQSAERKRAFLRKVLARPRDLSMRQTPGVLHQFHLMVLRICKAGVRSSKQKAWEYIVLMVAGAAVGFLSSSPADQLGGREAYSNICLAMGLLMSLPAARSFAEGKPQLWRECAWGLSPAAVFCARDCVRLLDVLWKPLVFLALFYSFNSPPSPFLAAYAATLALAFCLTGIAYVFGIAVATPVRAQLGATALCLLSVLVATRKDPGGVTKVLYNLSYSRWALEAYTVTNAKRYVGVWLPTRCTILQDFGYDIGNFGWCIAALLLYGFVARIAAFLCLVLYQRENRK